MFGASAAAAAVARMRARKRSRVIVCEPTFDGAVDVNGVTALRLYDGGKLFVTLLNASYDAGALPPWTTESYNATDIPMTSSAVWSTSQTNGSTSGCCVGIHPLLEENLSHLEDTPVLLGSATLAGHTATAELTWHGLRLLDSGSVVWSSLHAPSLIPSLLSGWPQRPTNAAAYGTGAQSVLLQRGGYELRVVVTSSGKVDLVLYAYQVAKWAASMSANPVNDNTVCTEIA